MASLLQESGYDENVLDATILSKLPPLSVEGVARIIIDTFYTSTTSARSGSGTHWQLKLPKKFLDSKFKLFHPVSFFFPPPSSSQRLGESVGGRKDGNKSDLKRGSCHV